MEGGEYDHGRGTTLISTSLSPLYHMSVYMLPKTIVQDIDKLRRTFFWQGGGTKRKYHLVKWTKLCKSKKKGGVGIKNLELFNFSLLCKWWWKLEHENGLWQDLVKAKYMSKSDIHNVSHRLGDSHIWGDLLKVKHIYLQGMDIQINDGACTRFWEDKWLFNQPLCCLALAPVLYTLCEQKGVSVANVKNGTVKITFRRWLHRDLQNTWDEILGQVESFHLSDSPDSIGWKGGKKNIFSVKSVYNALTASDFGHCFNHIWKGKIPAKIKFFMWLMEHDAILTKDNMIKKKNGKEIQIVISVVWMSL